MYIYSFPLPFAALVPPTLATVAPCLDLALPNNGAQLEQCTAGLLHGPEARCANDPEFALAHAYPSHRPNLAEKNHQARNRKAGGDWIRRGHQPQWWI